VIVSNLDKDVTEVKVTAVLLDQAGNAQGAGFTFVDSIPARQSAAFQISFVFTPSPATISFFGDITSLSTVGE
jgi:hypothetical protein